MELWTDAGLRLAEDVLFGRRPPPGGFFVALVREGKTPGRKTERLTELNEVEGGGYQRGGLALKASGADFKRLSEGVTIRDIQWTAKGGALRGARWAVLTTGEKRVSDRVVVALWDLSHPREISEGQDMRLRQMGVALKQGTSNDKP